MKSGFGWHIKEIIKGHKMGLSRTGGSLQKLEDELFSLLKSLFFCELCFGKNLGDTAKEGESSAVLREMLLVKL